MSELLHQVHIFKGREKKRIYAKTTKNEKGREKGQPKVVWRENEKPCTYLKGSKYLPLRRDKGIYATAKWVYAAAKRVYTAA